MKRKRVEDEGEQEIERKGLNNGEFKGEQEIERKGDDWKEKKKDLQRECELCEKTRKLEREKAGMKEKKTQNRTNRLGKRRLKKGFGRGAMVMVNKKEGIKSYD